MDVDDPKVDLDLWPWVKGQRHEVKKTLTLFQVSFDHLTGNVQGQWSGSKVAWVKVKGQMG